MKNFAKKPLKTLLFAFFVILGISFFQSAILSHDAFAEVDGHQGGYSSGDGGSASGRTYYRDSAFWNYLEWTNDRDKTFNVSLKRHNPLTNAVTDIGGEIWEACHEAEGFWAILTNAPVGSADPSSKYGSYDYYRGYVRTMAEYSDAYRDYARGWPTNNRGASYFGYRLFGGDPSGFVTISGENRAHGAETNYSLAWADYQLFMQAEGISEYSGRDWWHNGKLSFFCKPSNVRKDVELASKSAVKYKEGSAEKTAKTDLDKTKTVEAVVDTDTVDVTFEQYLYSKEHDPSDFPDAAIVNYQIRASRNPESFKNSGESAAKTVPLPPVDNKSNVALNSFTWAKADDETDYYRTKVTNDSSNKITVPIPKDPNASVTVCQGIHYDPKKFKISGSTVSDQESGGYSEICITFKRKPSSSSNQFKSKSGAGFNGVIYGETDYDGTDEIPGPSNLATSTIAVNFTQKLFVTINGVDSEEDLRKYSPTISTTYRVESSTGAPKYGPVSITTKSLEWHKLEDEPNTFYILREYEIENFPVPTGDDGARICQSIKYNPKYFTVTTGSSEVSYSGNGGSEICISFKREEIPEPEEYICPKDRYDATISYGNTYGFSEVTDLTTNKSKSTLRADDTEASDDDSIRHEESGPGTDGDNDFDQVVRIYTRPGDTVYYRHALCYGAQVVRSSNNKYIKPNTARASMRNLKENSFKIIGNVRYLSYQEDLNGERGKSIKEQYESGRSEYAFGEYDSREVDGHGGVVGVGELTLKAGINRMYGSSNPALLTVLNSASTVDHGTPEVPINGESENTKQVNVNKIGHWGFRVSSPFNLGTSLKCSGTYYNGSWAVKTSENDIDKDYIKNANNGGYQTISDYNDMCERPLRDVGKGIAQQITYENTKNWIKEVHTGTQNSTYWCKCNPRKYFHNPDPEVSPWANAYDDQDNNKYTDLKTKDLRVIYGDGVNSLANNSDSAIAKDPLGGPGNWGRERSGNDNSGIGSPKNDAEVNKGRDTEIDTVEGHIQYDNTVPGEFNSTLSIGNRGTVSYSEAKSIIGGNHYTQAGWLWFECTAAGTCADDWYEYAVTVNEGYNIMPDYKDSDTSGVTSSPSEWSDSAPPEGYDNAPGSPATWYSCDGGSTFSSGNYKCSDGYGTKTSASIPVYRDGDCNAWDDAGNCTGHEEVFDHTEYYYSCPNYGGGYGTSAPSCWRYYDDSKLYYSYTYYHCPSDYPFTVDYPGNTRGDKEVGTRWTKSQSEGITCYQHHYVCPESFSKDGLSYKVFGDDQYNFPTAACRTHACPDGTVPNNKNTDTQHDVDEENACSKCRGDVKEAHSYDFNAVSVLRMGSNGNFATGPQLIDPNGYNPSNPTGSPGDKDGSKDVRGCQYKVNNRASFAIKTNEVKSNIRNNGRDRGDTPGADPHKLAGIPDGTDEEPIIGNNKYRNTGDAVKITKTAEILVPYNYYVTTESSISESDKFVYLGENMTANTKVQVHPRENAKVKENDGKGAYATYTFAGEDDPDETINNGRDTITAVIQFIVSPKEKMGKNEDGSDNDAGVYTGEVKAGWDGKSNGNPEALCEAFGRTYGTNCEFIGDPVYEVLNADGDPSGATETNGKWIQKNWTVTVPDDPKQVEVGSLFCIAVGVYPADSHGTGIKLKGGEGADRREVDHANMINVSGMSHFDDAKWSVSDASCRTVTKKPNFQVWNGGTYTEGSIDTALATKAANWTLNRKTANLDDYISYGSWDEFAVTAGGAIKNFASGAANGIGTQKNKSALSPDYALQTISNAKADDGNLTWAGGSGITGITPDLVIQKLLSRYADSEHKITTFPLRSVFNSAEPDHQIGGRNSNSNAYYYQLSASSGTPAIVGGATVNTGTHIIYYSGDVVISGNICIGVDSGGQCGSSEATVKALYKPDYVKLDIPSKGAADDKWPTAQNLILKNYSTKTYDKIEDIPQVIIIANNIYIDSSVTQVDAWLIAVSGASASGVGSYGTINTCYFDSKARIVNENLHLENCKKTLIVNGPVIANQLILNRTAGANQGEPKYVYCNEGGNLKEEAALKCRLTDPTDPKRTVVSLGSGSNYDITHLFDIGRQINLADFGSATPAEIFNMRTNNYLWAYSQLNRFTQVMTVYSRELAPRY